MQANTISLVQKEENKSTVKNNFAFTLILWYRKAVVLQTNLLCFITRSYIEFSLSPFFPILSPGPLNNSDIDSTHSSNISAGHVYTGNGHVMMPGSVIPPDALYAINNEVTKIPPTRSPSIHTNPQFAYEAVFNDSKVGPSILSTIPTGFPSIDEQYSTSSISRHKSWSFAQVFNARSHLSKYF